ncbi:uncharacterized protein LOC143181837 [Calliopsis andreniformis]|uniref:uncharacterized protein LOC143181837 n=1 Tax=Calliopsis andreniformis TaxID=337506 RepID=UPI003FCDE3A6
MFTHSILLAALVAFANAVVPSYIHVCGARNPDLDKCITDSVSALQDKLREGIPELDIPPGDPFVIDKVQLADMPNFKAVGTNIKLYGMSKYHLNNLHVDLKKHTLDIDLSFDENRMEAIYNISAKLLVPINEQGPIKLTAKNVNAKVKMIFKLIERNGKQYMYFPSMTTRLNIKDYTIKFEAQNFDRVLHDAISQALGNSHQEILAATRPNLEKAISEKCLEFANKICKHFTFDELFPDRE